jgi:hypothetical protein
VCLSKYAADKEPFKLMDAFLDGFAEKGILTRAEVAGDVIAIWNVTCEM